MPIAFLDLETRKKEVRPPFLSRNRPVTKRWETIVIGYCFEEGKPHTISGGPEQEMWDLFEELIDGQEVDTIVYAATRKFDEAIARGTFINARREYLDEPGPWPRLRSAQKRTWINIGPEGVSNPDGLSAQVPVLWEKGEINTVLKHCREDVLNLRLRYNERYRNAKD